ncbi:MAG TPA: hypothetical protein PLO78_08770 [Candidatus Omnitrophota bacterium]|nr:hypothetical protein [Candidatus Omnitrophota bacterium]
MELDILERVKKFAPTESYITTFGVDLLFYEKYFLPTLQRSGCYKNVIFVDAYQYDKTMSEGTALGFSGVGTEYLLLPFRANLAFHPKVYFFVREKKDTFQYLCLLGSGNLTHSGLTRNKELFVEIEAESSRKPGVIWRDIIQYFNKLFLSQEGQPVRLAQDWFSKNLPQEFGSDKESQQLRFISAPDKKSILSQFKEMVPEEKVEKILMFAPFFDGGLHALDAIEKMFLPREIEIMFQPHLARLPKDLLRDWIRKRKHVRLLQYREKDERRYLHAKSILISTKKQDYLLIGSANLTSAALLTHEAQEGNFEACFCVTLPKDSETTVLDIASISESAKIDDLDILPELVLEQKESVYSDLRFTSAVCTGQRYEFFLDPETPKAKATLEAIRFDGAIIENFLDAQLSVGDQPRISFLDKNQALLNAVSVRLRDAKGKPGLWTPITRFENLRRILQSSRGKVDQIRDQFLSAVTEEGEEHYLNLMMEYLIDQTVEEQKNRIASKSKGQKDATGGSEDSSGYQIGDAKLPERHRREESWDLGDLGFVSGFDYLIHAIKQKKTSKYRDADAKELRVEGEGEEDQYDKAINEKLGEEQKIKRDLYSLAKQLAYYRRKFKSVAQSNDPAFGNGFSLVCFFLLTALPHVPHLSKRFPKGQAMSNEVWEEFIMNAAFEIGRRIYSGDGKAKLSVGYVSEEVLEVSLSALSYVISTIFIFIKRSAEQYGDDQFFYALVLTRIMMILTAMLEAMPGSTQTKIEALRAKLVDVTENFPCGWLHVQKYQEDFLICVADFVDRVPKKETTIGPIKIVSGSKGELEFSCRGRRISLWSNDLAELKY